MDPIVAPPVRVLDFGYQAPNPIDFERAGSAIAAPVAEAVQANNAAKNQFLLNQINNQKAFELAKWQHAAQIQREQLRDQRMLQVAQMRAQAQVEALKEKGALDDIKAKSTYLTSRLGGNPVSRLEGESDAAYGKRLDDAIAQKLQNNITTDSKAAFSIRQQIDAYNKFLSDPRVSQAVGSEVQQASANPGVQAQAQNYVEQNFSNWLNRVAPDNADVIQEAISKAPAQRAAIMQRAGLGDAYSSFVNSAMQTAAYGYLKQAGSPAARQYAAANENLRILGQQLRDLSMMPGDNGRMVPKSWWPQVQNATDEMVLHDQQIHQAQKATGAGIGAVDPVTGAPVSIPIQPQPSKTGAPTASRNPIAAPATPAFDASGNAINTSPFADLGRSMRDASYFTPNNGVNPNNFTDQDRAAAAAANPGFWSGVLHAPGMAVRSIGSLFNSNISPMNAIPSGEARYMPLQVPPEVAAKIAAARANPVSAPTVQSTSPGAGTPVIPVGTPNLPVLPPLQAVPAGATISPLAGVPVPADPVSGSDYQNPYDNVLQLMQMRNLYSQ